MKNNELNLNYAYLSSTTMVGLSVEEIKKLRAARKRLKDSLEEYNATRKDIWESYKINDDKDLEIREDKEDILKKVTELDTSDSDIADGELSFLPEEKIIGIAPTNFNHNDIDVLVKLLCIENNSSPQ